MKKYKACCVIPVRLDSTRFPSKVLLPLNGKIILDRVIDLAKECDFDKIVLATNSDYIQEFYSHKVEVLLMKEDVWCGSQRAFYVYKEYPNYDYYVTIPSDEPLIDSNELRKSLLSYFSDKTDLIATMGSKWDKDEFYRYSSNRSCKIITSNDYVLYFSRAMVPFTKESTSPMEYSKKHLGVFIFSKELFENHNDNAWSNHENSVAKAESLEQTIFLENGFKVKYVSIKHRYYGVDTMEDLKELEFRIDNN